MKFCEYMNFCMNSNFVNEFLHVFFTNLCEFRYAFLYEFLYEFLYDFFLLFSV